MMSRRAVSIVDLTANSTADEVIIVDGDILFNKVFELIFIVAEYKKLTLLSQGSPPV